MKNRGATLSEAVMRQRGRMTQEELADKAGVSVDTVQAIELGRRTTFRAATKNALETALGWKRGSIDAILAGGNPTVDDTVPAAPRVVVPTVDPMTANHVELGRVADWISTTAHDTSLGERWMARVLGRRAAVRESHSSRYEAEEAKSDDAL
jgi:DNA-binding XRE family transcriptional regulator